jgi:biotin synthase-like enzyme
VKLTTDLALSLYKVNKNAWFPFNIFTPFPGTPMYKKSEVDFMARPN